MFRRHPIATSAAALAAAGAALVPATFAQSEAPETLTLQLRHRDAKVSFVDVAPKMTRRRQSESPGDLAVGTAKLRSASGQEILGHSHQSFMITGGRGEATTEHITATFVLRDGQITCRV